MKKNIFMMALLAFLFISGCKSKEEKEVSSKFLVTSAVKMDTTFVRHYVCQIQSIRHIELRSQEKGYLQKIYVDEGQYVRKGTLLFRIMPALYEAELQKSKAEALASTIEVQNARKLADKNIVSPNELALAKAKLGHANAEVQLARTHLGFTEIRAPFDGIVGRLATKLGSVVDENDLLTTLSDNSTMWVYFNVPEAEYLNYKQNIEEENLSQVQLQMANQQIFPYNGTVKTIEADFNNETGNIAFRATFPNPKSLLRDGETGDILMTIPYKNAVIIPEKATFEVLDRKYVYIVDAQNKVRMTPIEVAAEIPDLYIIKDGLNGGEKVLLEGIRKVTNNQKIAFDYEAPKTVFEKLKLPAE